jgi:translation initiation factor IF-1
MAPVLSMSEKRNQQAENTVRGIVTEALPNTMFRVALEMPDGEEKMTLAYLSGRMKRHRIKVLIGDTVEVLLDQYGGEKGRVVRRL